ncbi:pentapeptide repeat-containing protein [Roseateles sp. P5_E4]
MASLHESTDFAGRSDLPRGWENDVFLYCTFSNLNVEGAAFEGVLSSCRVNNSSWYWGLFNTAKFVEVEFTNCVFRGSAFAGCLFVKCRFVNCKFAKDNLDANCRFDECSWHDCEQTGCEGLPRQFAAEGKRRK